MNRTLFVMLVLAVTSASAADITTRDGTTYRSAKVTAVEGDGIRIMHSAGVAKLPFEELPDALQTQYHYDRAKVAAYRKQQEDAQKAAAAEAAAAGKDQRRQLEQPRESERQHTEEAGAIEQEAKRAEQQKITPPKPEEALPGDALNAVVTISGKEGSGTGFICHFRGKTYIATNQHVLAAGEPLYVRTRRGDSIVAQQFVAAADADIALIECSSVPPGITPLEIATMPDSSIVAGDPVMVPGNSKGNGVITQTSGKLLAIGPQRIEIDNPVFHGNSGSPIYHPGSGKVIGVLTEAELLTFDQFDKASFRSKKSAIKSEIRYFGHRIDSVQKWEALNWRTFQQTELLLKESRDELDNIIAYFTNSSERYKSFGELHVARNRAATIYNDKNHSLADKKDAFDRFLRDIDWLVGRARGRLANRRIYYSQRNAAEAIFKIADLISGGTTVAKRDNELIATLLQRGN